MDSNKFIRSVRLRESACRGCINCIKNCPTQAIRVHNGKAHIIDKVLHRLRPVHPLLPAPCEDRSL